MDKSRYTLITFDVYTALFDIETSLTPLVRDTLKIEALSFVRAWRSKQLEYALISNSLGATRIPFEALTRRSLDDTLFRHMLNPSEVIRTELVHAWHHLCPWQESAKVVQSLHERGYTLGLLSNGDHALLDELSKTFPPVFEHIFSSEEAGYYKPHPSIYALPFQRLGIPVTSLLHVAGSPTDVLGAKSARLQCVWSNRLGQPYLDVNHKADYELKDLSGLLDILK